MSASVYQIPNLDHPLFDPGNVWIAEAEKQELLDYLIYLGNAAETPSLLRSKALALALNIDPLNRVAFTANIKLGQGEIPPVEGVELVGSPPTGAKLWDIASKVRQHSSAGPDNKNLAAYTIDLALALEPENIDYAFELRVLEKDGATVDWTQVFGDEAVAKPSPNLLVDPFSAENLARAPGAPLPEIPMGSSAKLERVQAQVYGLLVRSMEANLYAGQASQMNATAVRLATGREMQVTFNQEVGPSMESALGEVVKFLRLRHGALPANYHVELAFEEQYVPKDGPSAAVACALMLESLITGAELDPEFAVTGDLNADGSVQPVGGITGKLRGASTKNCNVMAIPSVNARVITDLLIMEGPQVLTDIQIFALDTFEDAFAIGQVHAERSEPLRRSIEIFGEVAEVLRRPNGFSFLKNAHVQERLRECIELTPSHLSAKYLLLASLGRAPEVLSLPGSLEYIDRAAEPLLRVVREGDFDQRSAFDDDEFADAAKALRKISDQLDPRTRKISGSIIAYSVLIRKFANYRPKSPSGLRSLVDDILAAGRLVSGEYEALESRVDYQEEMMR